MASEIAAPLRFSAVSSAGNGSACPTRKKSSPTSVILRMEKRAVSPSTGSVRADSPSATDAAGLQ